MNCVHKTRSAMRVFTTRDTAYFVSIQRACKFRTMKPADMLVPQVMLIAAVTMRITIAKTQRFATTTVITVKLHSFGDQ